MKTPALVCLSVSTMLLFGCQKNEELPSPEPPPSKVPAASNNAAAAPSGYLGAVGRAEQSMEKTVDTAALNNAVQLFNAQEGRAPESLDELVQKHYIGKLPTPPFGTKLQYDKAKGTVTVVKQ